MPQELWDRVVSEIDPSKAYEITLVGLSRPQQISVLLAASEKLRAGVAQLERHLNSCPYEIVFVDDLSCIPGCEDIEVFVEWLLETRAIRDSILQWHECKTIIEELIRTKKESEEIL